MKLFSIRVLPAGRWRILRTIWFLVTILFFSVAASTTHAQTNTGFSGFTQSFNPATSNILFTTANSWNFFHVGDPVGLATVDGSNLNVFAWYGALVYSGPATNLYLPAGHYFVEAPGDRNQFAVVPADWSPLSTVGWSGDPDSDPGLMGTASFLKLGWVRIPCNWDSIQAGGSNSWDWTTTDQYVAAHYGLRKIELTLQGPPLWTRDPVIDVNNPIWLVSPSQFAQAFAQFVQAAAQRYSNLVDVVEVWNEPGPTVLPTTNLTDEANLFVTMLAAARAAFPPSVKLSGPTFNSPFLYSWAQVFANAGASPYLDYDTYHDYEESGGSPDVDVATNPAWSTIPQRVQDNFAVFGKPIIVDEVGLFGQSALGDVNPSAAMDNGLNSGLSWLTGMVYAVKYAVMYAANNVMLMPESILESAGSVTNNDEVLGFDIGGRGPHPKTSAFFLSEYWLTGATFVNWRSPGTQVFLYAWQRTNNTSIVFAWATDGQSFPLSTNTAFSITDVYGRSIQPGVLTAQPVIFQTNSPNAAALLSNVVAALPPMDIPPVLTPLSNQNVYTNQLLQFTVSATDPNNDPITYAAVPLPSGASINPTNGTFSWIPSASQGGVYNITFVATDSAGRSASNTTIISVLNSETDGLVDWWKLNATSGTIAADSAGANPGTLVGFNFTGTSGWTTGIIGGGALLFDGANAWVDLDNSTLSLSNNFAVSTWINPHDAANGYGVYFCLRSIYAASGFRFWVTDNSLYLAGQTTTGWNQTVFAAGQIQNDTWYQIVVVYDKSNLEVYLNGVPQSPDYTGNPNWGGDFVMNPGGVTRIGAEFGSGPVGFFFNGLIDDVRVYNRTLIPAEVQALYQDGEQLLVLAPISAKTVAASQSLAFTLSATDPDSTNLTYSANPLPSGATFSASAGAFAWTPSLLQTGTYSVTFSVTDGLLTNSQSASITVTGSVNQVIDQPPVLAPINAKTVAASQSLAFTLSATDPDSTNLTFSANLLPSGANFSASTGAFAWTPSLSQTGTYSVTFSVTDGLLTNSQSASITVTGSVNQVTGQPLVLASVGAQNVIAGQLLAFTLSATDSDSSNLTYSANALPNGASLNAATGAFAWTPSSTQTGTYSVTFMVSDGQLTTSQAAQITVTLNAAPITITVQVNPSDGGTASGGGAYAVGSQAQIAAAPNPGWMFTGWSDGNTQNPRMITVRQGGASFTANVGQQSTSATVQITSGPSVTNAVLQVGGLAIVVADETNVLAVTATDATTNALFYTWVFGDGQTGDRSSSSMAAHVYTNCGPYIAGVTVDDGVNSTNANFTIAVTCLLNITKLQVAVNFAKTNADTCTVKGSFDLPADYNFAGKLLTFDIGGAEVSFTLDSKGRGHNGLSLFNKPSYNAKTGLWTFNATLRGGSWQPFWSARGLVNASVLRPGNAVSLPVILVIDDEAFMQIPNLLYTSKVGKSGTAR